MELRKATSAFCIFLTEAKKQSNNDLLALWYVAWLSFKVEFVNLIFEHAKMNFLRWYNIKALLYMLMIRPWSKVGLLTSVWKSTWMSIYYPGLFIFLVLFFYSLLSENEPLLHMVIEVRISCLPLQMFELRIWVSM